jgi:hypothetical protein
MSWKAGNEAPGARLSLLKQEAAPPAAAPPAAHVRMAFAVLLPLLGHQPDMVRLVIQHRRALVLDKASVLEVKYAKLSAGALHAMENLRHEEHEIWSILTPSMTFKDECDERRARQTAFSIDVRTRDHCVNVLAELSLLKQEVACFRRHSGIRRNVQVGAVRGSVKTLLSSIDEARTRWQHMLENAQADVDRPCYLSHY